MLTPDLLHDYQKKAVNFQCTHAHSMLWLDMGLGKTVITLTSLAHLINTGFLRGVIIVAPIRVIRLVWRQEAAKWEHTKHLRFSMVAGTKDQRTRALLRPADVYLINYENLGWLAETLQTYFVKKTRPMPSNGIIWDEISKMKNSATNRVKAFRKIEDTIKKLIGDITLEMSAEDYNPLPDLIVNNVEIEMPDDLRAKYDRLEKEFFLVHDMKLDALEDIIDEAQGSPILCAYAYRSDAERIMTRFKDLRPINLTECKSEASLTNAMHRWKTGDCQLMIGHPASMGHGIDGLQKNGHILVWYGLNWSLDLYEQFNARVRRQGQGAPVMCHRILMLNTLDHAQALALDEKATTQAGLRNAIKQYRISKNV